MVEHPESVLDLPDEPHTDTEMDMGRVVAVFCDGGCVEGHPSAKGGTWAWCGTDTRGYRIVERSGGRACRPGHRVTTNSMEWFAVLRALEMLPDGWSGIVHTDSRNAIYRLQDLIQHLHRGMEYRLLVPLGLHPSVYRRMINALRRVDYMRIDLRHLKGHPNGEDLKRGYTVYEDGVTKKYDVSPHQVWCDQECNRQKTRVSLMYAKLVEHERVSA